METVKSCTRSHVSASYSIQAGSEVSPDYQVPGSSMLKPVIFNWAITQDASIKNQLNTGVRYLDLRLASKPGTKSLYIVNGLYGSEIGNILNEARVFLDHHKNEVIILDFQQFYNFTEENHSRLKDLIENIFEGKLCPLPDNLFDLTLASMQESGQQVIVIYREDSEGKAVFWPSRSWPLFEASVYEVEPMLRELEQDIASRPSRATGYTSVCTIVPNMGFIISNTMSNLKDTCVTPCDELTVPWVEIHRPGHAGFNVLVTDFIDRIDFCKSVVQLNRKLMRWVV